MINPKHLTFMVKAINIHDGLSYFTNAYSYASLLK